MGWLGWSVLWLGLTAHDSIVSLIVEKSRPEPIRIPVKLSAGRGVAQLQADRFLSVQRASSSSEDELGVACEESLESVRGNAWLGRAAADVLETLDVDDVEEEEPISFDPTRRWSARRTSGGAGRLTFAQLGGGWATARWLLSGSADPRRNGGYGWEMLRCGLGRPSRASFATWSSAVSSCHRRDSTRASTRSTSMTRAIQYRWPDCSRPRDRSDSPCMAWSASLAPQADWLDTRHPVGAGDYVRRSRAAGPLARGHILARDRHADGAFRRRIWSGCTK